jgi:hypothetical protein
MSPSLGMLLLNRGVYSGSTIMFESGGVPEDHFPLAPVAAAQQEQEAAVGVAREGAAHPCNACTQWMTGCAPAI